MKGSRTGRNVIKQRILTGLIALPLLILFIWFASPLFFQALIWVVGGIGLWEFVRMTLPEEREMVRRLATAGGVLLLILFCRQDFLLAMGGMTGLFLAFAIWFLFRFRDLETVMQHHALVFLGYLYVGGLLAHLVFLRELPLGREWIYLTLLVTMSSDTLAYFVGRFLGRRKLYPAISPNKSIEGALGGLAGAVGGALIAKAWFMPGLGILACLVLGVLLGSLAQVGDLFESMLKRGFKVKDSGGIIPGHGGILDRLDSLLFVFPPAYYYALYFPAG